MARIETERLQLVPATIDTLHAELVNPARLAAIARMDVSPEWPPELYDRDPIIYTLERLEAAPDEEGWWMYYFVRKATLAVDPLMLGCGGYKGPPSADGTVEIGYSIVPEERCRGYATEAARGLIHHAFEDDAVRQVIAETLPSLRASIRVLEKCGFRLAGAGSEEGVIRYELSRRQAGVV